MTIETVQGDLFSVTEGYIVHGCNAQGVMGSGVAKIVKEKYFSAFKLYAECLQRKRVKGDSALGTCTYSVQPDNLIIVNAVTQEYYGGGGKLYTDYDAIECCFSNLIDEIDQHKDIFKNVPNVINFPLIGCGLGGGEWNIVSEIIDHVVDDSFIKRLWVL